MKHLLAILLLQASFDVYELTERGIRVLFIIIIVVVVIVVIVVVVVIIAVIIKCSIWYRFITSFGNNIWNNRVCTSMDIMLSRQSLSTCCNQTRWSIGKTASTIWTSSGVLFGTASLLHFCWQVIESAHEMKNNYRNNCLFQRLHQMEKNDTCFWNIFLCFRDINVS